MNPSLSELIVAILSYVTEHGGYVTKTKLLKLLYLFDVEFYRAYGRTFTGFQWKYFHLGPWTKEFDPLLDHLVSHNQLAEHVSERSEFDTRFLQASERVDLQKAVGSYTEEAILRSVLDTWGESTTGEILDYVYFRTEPMEFGVRNEHLDFSKVGRQAPGPYKRTPSGKPPGEIKALRREFGRKMGAQASVHTFEFTPPDTMTNIARPSKSLIPTNSNVHRRMVWKRLQGPCGLLYGVLLARRPQRAKANPVHRQFCFRVQGQRPERAYPHQSTRSGHHLFPRGRSVQLCHLQYDNLNLNSR